MDLLAKHLAHTLLFGEALDPKQILRQLNAQWAKKAESPARQRHEIVTPCAEWDDWEYLSEWAQAAARELEEDLTLIFALKDYDHNSFSVSTPGHQYYKVFRNEDAAIQTAVAQAIDSLNDEPETWNYNGFIHQFINMDELKKLLHDDARDDDYWNDEHPDDESKIKTLLARGYLNDDPLVDSDGNTIDTTPEIEQLIADKWEELIDDHAAKSVEDPIEYLMGFYTEDEAYKRAIDLVGIDVDAAAEAAVETDGWQLFLSTNDGESHDLPGGAVYVKQ